MFAQPLTVTRRPPLTHTSALATPGAGIVTIAPGTAASAKAVDCHAHGTGLTGVLPPSWDHPFAIDGTTWLAVLPVMGPPGVALVLPVARPLYWPNELPGGVGDRDRGDAARHFRYLRGVTGATRTPAVIWQIPIGNRRLPNT